MGGLKRPHNSRLSPRRVKAAERQRQAMQLRIAGASFQAIANELGYSDHKSAERAIIAGLRAFFREPAQDLLRLELERLDRLQMAVWPNALAGDIPAVTTVLRIMERRARYAGLDAPTRIDSNVEFHAQMDVNLEHALVIPGSVDKAGFVAAMRAIRGELPAIEGSSTVVENGPPPDGAKTPAEEPDE